MLHEQSRTFRRQGFSLIELLIVIAIIGILAGVIIPQFQGSVRKAHEAAAVATLNAIRVAQAKYATDHKGSYGKFSELFEQGYLDKRFKTDEPHERGYIFVLTLTTRADGKATMFRVNANPEQATGIGATGKVFFYMDPDSGICFSTTAPATAADETL